MEQRGEGGNELRRKKWEKGRGSLEEQRGGKVKTLAGGDVGTQNKGKINEKRRDRKRVLKKWVQRR